MRPNPTTRSTARLSTAVAVAGAVALFARGTARLRDAGLFAEDGQIFLSGAHNDGLHSIVEPYAGYVHLIPRLLALAIGLMPLTAAPVLYVLAAMIVHLVMLMPALSSRLSWLIPTPLLRACLFAALCVMPPMWEPYGNVANLIFIGGITLLLLVLSTDPLSRAGRVAESAAIVLLGLSGPLIVLFTPFIGWRWWRNGRTRHSLMLLALTVACSAVQLSIYTFSDRSTPGGGTARLLAQTAVERVGGSWLVGDANVFVVQGQPFPTIAAVWLVVVAGLSLYALRTTAVALWLLSAVLLLSAVHAYGAAMVASSVAFQRHIVVPVAITIVLLFAVLATAKATWARALAALCLIAGIVGVVHDFVPAPYPVRPDLTELQHCVDSGAPRCTQPIFDGKWTVVLTR